MSEEYCGSGISLFCVAERTTLAKDGGEGGGRAEIKNISQRDLILSWEDVDKIVKHSWKANKEVSLKRDLGDNVVKSCDVMLFRGKNIVRQTLP